uniref:Histone domain-containing protein n=1 Tax=Trichuris muris TaxID=70415 RepID=A0A5S6Q4C1_TRIMR
MQITQMVQAQANYAQEVSFSDCCSTTGRATAGALGLNCCRRYDCQVFLTREGGTRKKWKRRLKFPRLADEGPQKKRRRRKGRKYDIGRAMFQAVVLEVIGRLGKQHVRFQCLAIDMLQSAAEAHVADVIQDARFVQTLGKRAKNLPKYIALAARLR